MANDAHYHSIADNINTLVPEHNASGDSWTITISPDGKYLSLPDRQSFFPFTSSSSYPPKTLQAHSGSYGESHTLDCESHIPINNLGHAVAAGKCDSSYTTQELNGNQQTVYVTQWRSSRFACVVYRGAAWSKIGDTIEIYSGKPFQDGEAVSNGQWLAATDINNTDTVIGFVIQAAAHTGTTFAGAEVSLSASRPSVRVPRPPRVNRRRSIRRGNLPRNTFPAHRRQRQD